VQWGTLYSAANGAAEDDAVSSYFLLQGNYGAASAYENDQGTGAGWANYFAAQAGDTASSALFTTAYNDAELASAADSAAAANSGNFSLEYAALSATITAQMDNITALNSVGDTNAADVEATALSATQIAQQQLVLQQKINAITGTTAR
jgi:hypothetical protein